MDYSKAIQRPFTDFGRTLKIFFIISLIALPYQILNAVLQGLDLITDIMPDNEGLLVVFLIVALLTIPFALFVGWLINGYIWRASKAVLLGDYSIPDLKYFWKMIGQGIKLWAFGLLWALIILVCIGIAVGLVALTYLAGEVAAIIVAIILALILLPLLVIFSYLLPVLMLEVIATNSIGAGFNLRRASSIAFTTDYFVAYIVAFLISLAGGIISFIILLILFITIIGWLFWATIGTMILNVILWTIYADAYKEVIQKKKLHSFI